MKIVVAPDSFKGSLSALDATRAIDRGVKKAYPNAKTVLLPMADGGEGTLGTLVAATKGEKRKVSVIGPLGNEVDAEYGILGDGQTCVIEMASASGLDLVPEDERNPLIATTFGTGQLIKKGMEEGFTSFIIALGGSATNDGGAGMLQALGIKLLDENDKEVSHGGAQLSKIRRIDQSEMDRRVKESRFLIATDVQNPLIGPAGASYVFGPQKGATSQDVSLLDANMTHWADTIEKGTGIRLHDFPGAGAAGGIGGALQAFFPAEIERGIDVVMAHTRLHEALADADLVITGEGQVDFQTASGKTPMGVAQAALEHNIPTIIIAGSVGSGVESLYQSGVVSIHSFIKQPISLLKAMDQASELLEGSAEQVVRTYFHHCNNTKRNQKLANNHHYETNERKTAK